MKTLKSAFLLIATFATASIAQSQVVLTQINTAYTQNFDTLSNTASSTTNALSITGWVMNETGGGARDNERYAVDTGSSNTGDTFSYGTASATDRALGSLRSGTLLSTFGASFTNSTGTSITSLTVSYTGEQWRLGTASRADRLDFQYSLDATSLTTGTWLDVNTLDFSTPNMTTTGAKDGNLGANQTALNHTFLTNLAVANGSTFFIRWVDADATSSDDGLAIDTFSLTPVGVASAIPEPSTYAAIFGGLALVGAVVYRRRQAKV